MVGRRFTFSVNGCFFLCYTYAGIDVMFMRKIKQYNLRLSTLISEFKDLYRFEEDNLHWLVDRFLDLNDET